MPPFFFLGYGVMVTLQILVLPFLVRVRVAQRSQSESHPRSGWLFLFSYRHIFNRRPVRMGGRDSLMKASFPASTCKDGCKYLQGRLQVPAGMVASTCRDGCTYLRGGLNCTCVDGCSTLRGGMQCTAWTVAVHCGSGCSALPLRWAKGAPKSPVLFWIREKGDKTHI